MNKNKIIIEKSMNGSDPLGIMNQKKKKQRNLAILLLTMVALIIGYAFLQTTLTISGASKIQEMKWNIYWDNIQVTTGSVLGTPSLSENDTQISFSVLLQKPSDFYEFTVDAVNEGTIDAAVESIKKEVNNSTTIPPYLIYTVTDENNHEIMLGQELAANSSKTYKIRVEYKEDILEEELPSANYTHNVTFRVNYVQSNRVIEGPQAVSFANDDWETIIGAVRAGQIDAYQVGDTKEITLENGLGTHTIRIANKSTPAECSAEGFSQTACGFVLEFTGIITYHRMSPYDSESTDPGNGNIGGWKSSEMRSYLNNENDSTSIINSLPEVLRNGIINTVVVSGHGSTEGETNFETIDKLYLLSIHEVWEDEDKRADSGINTYDTAYDNTRQLDYYAGLHVTNSDYRYAKKSKKNANSYSNWWLRSAYSGTAATYNIVKSPGSWWWAGSNNNNTGISPAFRIG